MSDAAIINFTFHSCHRQTELACKVVGGDTRLFGTDCVNQAFGGEEHPFSEGDGNEMDHALYVPSSVEITYKICN